MMGTGKPKVKFSCALPLASRMLMARCTARLLTALNAVQSKLSEIENENSISRRRVQELELELEACKQDVARERTRVLEKEEILLQQRRKLARETQTETDERYKQVVEEKKGWRLFHMAIWLFVYTCP